MLNYEYMNTLSYNIFQGVKYYGRLKNLQNNINSLLNHVMLFYCITLLMYYAESPYILFQKENNLLIAQLGYLILHSLFWIVAANYNQTVSPVKICIKPALLPKQIFNKKS